jgi:hypothetical protein
MEFLDWLTAEFALVVGVVKAFLDAPGVQVLKWLLGLAALSYAVRVVVPTWRLLALSLYRDLPWSLSRSLGDLLKLDLISLSREKWYRSARVRIEWELLRPRPVPPPRHLALPRRDAGEVAAQAKRRYRQAVAQYRADLGEWKTKLAAHLTRFSRGESRDVIIEVEDVSQIYARSDEIRNYFGVLATDRSAERQGADRFISQVRVKRGFVAPLHLVAGLLAECEDDWAPVIEDYGDQVAQPLPAPGGGAAETFANREAELKLQRLQTFLFDCWLLWGPSIPMCTCEAWHGGRPILQFGFGDENNSLSLVFDRPVAREKLQGYFASDDVHGVTLALKVTGVIGTLKWGPSIPPSEISLAQQSICDPDEERLTLHVDELPLLAAGDLAEGSARYYSAYLWSMFVICGEGFEPLFKEQTWRGVLPFFEHANIAEEQTMAALKNQLVVKTLTTVQRLLRELPRLHLRFVCAIDESCCGSTLLCPPPATDSMRELMQQVIDTEPAFADLRANGTLSLRLKLDQELWRDGEYSSCHLPDLIGRYYDYLAGRREADASSDETATSEAPRAAREVGSQPA